MTALLTVTQGIPASGKSTWARAEAQHSGVACVSRDDFRQMLYGQYAELSPEQEQTVTTAQEATVKELLRSGRSVIVHDTNLSPWAKRWPKLAQSCGAQFEARRFPIDIEEAIQRDEARAAQGERAVGEAVIRKFAARKVPALRPLEPFTIEPVEVAIGLPPAYIFDIDGTLAHNVTGRPWYGGNGEEALGDAPDRNVLAVLDGLRLHCPSPEVFLVSGRSEDWRETTECWLEENEIWHSGLFMRASGDYRRDDMVKYGIFNEHFRGKYNVLGVFDDRDQCIRLWRKMGLKAYQVAEGNF
jgi:predicted kinase